MIGQISPDIALPLICYLLWRVETLSDLSISNLPHTVGEVVRNTMRNYNKEQNNYEKDD